MAIQNLGNKKGFIYITDKNDNILSNIPNDSNGKKSILKDALTNSSLASTPGGLFQDKKYYLNIGGAEGSITGATEITSYVTNVGLNNKMPSSSISISSNILTYTRTGSIQKIVLDTESSQATSDCLYIREANSVISDGDILIIVGTDTARVSTLWDADGDEAYQKNLNVSPAGDGKIFLDTGKSWSTGGNESSLVAADGIRGTVSPGAFTIMLMYSSTSGCWYEINRVPVDTDILLGNIVTVDKLKASGVNIKKEGVKRVTTISGGDSLTPVADTTEGIIEVSGTHSLGSGNYTVDVPSGGSAREGDEYVVRWSADMTTSGTVSVFGKTLVSADYSAGSTKPFEIKTRYINGAWTTVNPITKDAAAMERSLGNPSADGMLLSSTALGVRSWTSLGDSMKIKKYTWSFAANGGAISTILLGAADESGLPKGAIVDASRSVVQTETIVTGNTNADIKIGLTCSSTTGGYQATDDDFFLANQDFNAAPFTAIGSVTKGPANIGMLFDTAIPSITITTATLTAGVINVYVAYYAAQ
tara:strand:- start:117 stop:1715 length:1599 start_codon:yes stop_codon:yes gene_type:complete